MLSYESQRKKPGKLTAQAGGGRQEQLETEKQQRPLNTFPPPVYRLATQQAEAEVVSIATNKGVN